VFLDGEVRSGTVEPASRRVRVLTAGAANARGGWRAVPVVCGGCAGGTGFGARRRLFRGVLPMLKLPLLSLTGAEGQHRFKICGIDAEIIGFQIRITDLAM
jgi:hypothetical protein